MQYLFTYIPVHTGRKQDTTFEGGKIKNKYKQMHMWFLK